MTRRAQDTLKTLLQLILVQGRERVLPLLEAQHRVVESYYVALCAEPETSPRLLRRVAEQVERQAVTLGRLHQWSDDDIRQLLSEEERSYGRRDRPGAA